jgi:hypothetical protein
MPAKRHHYVPREILRRFSSELYAGNPKLWRLDKDSGRPSEASVNGEAVIGHYYRLEGSLNLPPTHAEETLARIEGEAAEPIRKLVEGEPLNPVERLQMAMFLHVQRQRTPRARQWSAFFQERVATIQMEVNLSDPERVREHAKSLGERMSDDEIERWRVQTLEELRAGTLVLEAGQDHEVGGIFAFADLMLPIIADKLTWISLRAAPGSPFICSDHPLHQYQEGAPADRGVGWLSPGVEVTMPIDQRVCLFLTPGPPIWLMRDVDADTVRDVNLRTYASAEWAIYGPSQKSVQQVREDAKRDRAALRLYQPKGPRFVLLQTVEGEAKPRSTTVYRPPARQPERRPKR